MTNYIKIPEVTTRLGISEKTTRRLIKSGELPSVFFSNSYRVSEEDLQSFIEDAALRAKVGISFTAQEAILDALEAAQAGQIEDLPARARGLAADIERKLGPSKSPPQGSASETGGAAKPVAAPAQRTTRPGTWGRG